MTAEVKRGPVLRLFEVECKPGCAQTLLDKFESTSADVVKGQPGNLGYFFGSSLSVSGDTVIFASLWSDLDAIKARFGDEWQESFLPPGYDTLIARHSIRHMDLTGGWHPAVK